MKCVDVKLSDDIMKRLDEVSSIEYGFLHDFLLSAPMIQNGYSGMKDRIVK